MLKFPYIQKYNPFVNFVAEFEKRLSGLEAGGDLTPLMEVLEHPKCDKKANSDILGSLFSFYHVPYQISSALEAVFLRHRASSTDMNASVFEQALNLVIENKRAQPDEYKAQLMAIVLRHTPKVEQGLGSNPWIDKAICKTIKNDACYLLPAIFNHDDCKTSDMLNCANILLDEKAVLSEERNKMLSLKYIFEHERCDLSTFVNILDKVRTKQDPQTLGWILKTLGWILEQSQWPKDDSKIKDIHIHLLMERIIDDMDEKSLSAVLDNYNGADQILYSILLHPESYNMEQDECLEIVRNAQMLSTKKDALTVSGFMAELYAYALDSSCEDNNYRHMVMDIYDDLMKNRSDKSKSCNDLSFFEEMADKKLPAVHVLKDWDFVARQSDFAPCLAAAFKSAQQGDILNTATYLKAIEVGPRDGTESGGLTKAEKAQIQHVLEKARPENAQMNELYLKHLVYGG